MKIFSKSEATSVRRRSTLINPSNPGSGTNSRIARELEVNCELDSDSGGLEFESKGVGSFRLDAYNVWFWKRFRVLIKGNVVNQ